MLETGFIQACGRRADFGRQAREVPVPIVRRDEPTLFAQAMLRLFTAVPCVSVPVDAPADVGLGFAAFRLATPANRERGRNGGSPRQTNARPGTFGFLSADGVVHPLARWARVERCMEIIYHDARRWPEFERQLPASYRPASEIIDTADVVCIAMPSMRRAASPIGALDRAALELKTLLLAWPRAPEIERTAIHISEHSAERVCLPELAAMAGLSRYYLVRRFAAVLGATPHRLQLMFRIADARVLLRSGAEIGDVAQSVGFSDQSHLNRHFRALVGLTPGQYQKTMNNAISSKTLPCSST